MILRALLDGAGVLKTNADLDANIVQISSDSRGILHGGLFIAIRGTKTDGHRHISDALSRGASVVVTEDLSALPDGVDYVLVSDTRVAEAHIWNNWYCRPSDGMKTVAITGTNGKTSTAFVLDSILEAAGKSRGIITTVYAAVNGRRLGTYCGSSVTDAPGAMTTPDPEYFYGAVYEMKMAGAEYLVYEATSHALALHKTDPTKPDVAIFTNLTEEHLDFHGTMEHYFEAKARLGDMAGTLVINGDDPYLMRLQNRGTGRCVTCSADASSDRYLSADVLALRQEISGTGGISYIFFSTPAVFKVRCPLQGSYSVYNTMLAAAAALELGVPPEAVQAGIASMSAVPGRLEKVKTNADFDIFIDFAHTPDALEKLLHTLRSMRPRGGRIILLFGCGGNRDRSKRRKMGAVAAKLADITIVTEDNSRDEDPMEIIGEILTGIDRERPHAVIPDRRDAIKYAIDLARSGDIVVLAGKGHEKYELRHGKKLPFDEAAIAAQAVREKTENENK